MTNYKAPEKQPAVTHGILKELAVITKQVTVAEYKLPTPCPMLATDLTSIVLRAVWLSMTLASSSL